MTRKCERGTRLERYICKSIEDIAIFVVTGTNNMQSPSGPQAASYLRGSESQKCIGLRTIGMLDLTKGTTVLDLGCGTGYLTKVLSEKVGPEGKVVAVDPDGERLKIAREKHSANNIDYIQADDQTFPEGQYDVIFSNIVIHWISDKKALLKRVYENLSLGGRFVFTTGDGCIPIPEIGKKLFVTLVGPNFLQSMLHEKMIFLNEKDYEALAIRAGFRISTAAIIPEYPKWNNLDAYIDSMHGWFQGEFDPTQFDEDALQKLKMEYGSGPIIQTEPINTIHAILMKTDCNSNQYTDCN